MGSDDAESREISSDVRPAAVAPPVAPRRPVVVDAEFRVLPSAPRLWRLCREYWWALGPYLAYCAALWALVALISWVV
jgi:hypothetical protein